MPTFDGNNLFVNIVLAAVVAGVSAWGFREAFAYRLSDNGCIPLFSEFWKGVWPQWSRCVRGAFAGVSTASERDPRPGGWRTDCADSGLDSAPDLPESRAAGRQHSALRRTGVCWPEYLGRIADYWCRRRPGSSLYLSWGVACLLTGAISLALYRGLYVHIRQRARSPLIMLVATLGISAGHHCPADHIVPVYG